MRRLDLIIAGEPKPQPRPKARIAGKPPKQWVQVYEPATAKAWKAAVRACAQRHCKEPFDAPLRVYVEFRMRRPEGHYLRGAIRDTAPVWHTNEAGDVDNLVKAVMDALTDAGIWTGDGLVCQLRAEKRYVRRGEPIGCRVVIEHVNQDDALGLFSEFAQEAVAYGQ